MEQYKIKEINTFVKSLKADSLAGQKADMEIYQAGKGVWHVALSYQLTEKARQDDWQLHVKPAFEPEKFWQRQLTPEERHIISWHTFNAPALVMANQEKYLALVPDLDILSSGVEVPWYLDLDARKPLMKLGMSHYHVTGHVLYQRAAGGEYRAGKKQIGFYLICLDGNPLDNIWAPVARFQWRRWGVQMLSASQNYDDLLPELQKHAYDWAFHRWSKHVWQEFRMEGREVGAPVYMVNVTHSPNYPQPHNEREFVSVWNQAWFNSLRTATGLFRYARRHNDLGLQKKAQQTKELALAFPQKDGLFHSVVGTDTRQVEINGRKYRHSKGWSEYFLGNGNRNPFSGDAKTSPYHIADMSYTAIWMLNWYEELEKDERLTAYVKAYAERLLEIQDEEGFFPAYVDADSGEILDVLRRSPESSVSATMLLKLHRLAPEENYKRAGLKALKAVVGEALAESRWEDFETYWSCSTFGQDHLGKKFKRNAQYKQCTFSMFWTAEALFWAWKSTRDGSYLEKGRRVMDELAMYQTIWQPPYMNVDVFGGFAVMNADAEWLDARQSLFAELFIEYGYALNDQELVSRGMAALRASFAMMYCPENPAAKKQWEQRWAFFGPQDYGFMMENYGHKGYVLTDGTGMGVFSIFDWGAGAAAEAYNRILDHYGQNLFEKRDFYEIRKDMTPRICNLCGFTYLPAEGDPAAGISQGTSLEDVPDYWTCPVCGAGKDNFPKP